MKPELIVALDVQSSDMAKQLVDSLPPEVTWYKVGLELFTAEGPAALQYLRKKNKKIFLDLKFHDIPNTVAAAVTSAARHGVAMLTLHAGGGREMLRAAAQSAAKAASAAPKLVAVTTLTSLAQNDLTELGIARALAEHTLALGEMAISAGIDGLVCSPHEARAFRDKLGKAPILVTPGIRPAGVDVADQKRVATPEIAIQAGASFLVVGRPITQASDSASAAQAILREIERAIVVSSN
jgi:orotidine-5'-phosphate decarboxylase